MRLSVLVGLMCCLVLAQERRAPVQESFRFRAMGPAVGNRISAAAGIPGDPSTYYVGAASGGVWKSTNGGTTWNPIFDNQPVAAIGALAVASSDHKVVWAGTGEAWAIRDVDMTGDGVYKSIDEGKTWTHMGLDATGRIGRIPRIQMLFLCVPWVVSPDPSRSAESIALMMAERIGNAFCSPTQTRAAQASLWIRTIRACCLPECGKWRCTPTACSAADPPARSTFRATAVPSGHAWKVTGCQNRPWAK